MPLNTGTPTVLWTLRNGHRRLECSVQLLPHGLELHLALNGDTPYCSRTFQRQDELLAWAKEIMSSPLRWSAVGIRRQQPREE